MFRYLSELAGCRVVYYSLNNSQYNCYFYPIIHASDEFLEEVHVFSLKALSNENYAEIKRKLEKALLNVFFHNPSCVFHGGSKTVAIEAHIDYSDVIHYVMQPDQIMHFIETWHDKEGEPFVLPK